MWLAYAINKNTKQIVSFQVGKRTNKTLSTIIKTLINSKADKIYTDKLKNYQYLIPKEIHSKGFLQILLKELILRSELV
nr:IS1 family transposase [Chryseobacterium sp. Leaf405]